MSVCSWVYLDGTIVPARDAAVSPFDRAFLFAHGAYEVTAVYNGHLVDWPEHAARLARSLEGIDIPMPMDTDVLEAVHRTLIERNALKEGLIYLQVTAGSYGFRDFAGPEDLDPSLFLFATEKSLIGPTARDGIAAISIEDTRWKRRDYKTTQLLSQALAYRQARAAGAKTALMVEDGLVTEAASANAWIVTPRGELITRDLSSAILPGITRNRVQSLLSGNNLRVEERAFSLDEVHGASEAFTTSAGAIIAPIVSLDGTPIGSGHPGPVTRTIQRLYYQHIGADLEADAPWTLGGTGADDP